MFLELLARRGCAFPEKLLSRKLPEDGAPQGKAEWREGQKGVWGHHSKLWVRPSTRGNNWSSPDVSATVANRISFLPTVLRVESLKCSCRWQPVGDWLGGLVTSGLQEILTDRDKCHLKLTCLKVGKKKTALLWKPFILVESNPRRWSAVSSALLNPQKAGKWEKDLAPWGPWAPKAVLSFNSHNKELPTGQQLEDILLLPPVPGCCLKLLWGKGLWEQ